MLAHQEEEEKIQKQSTRWFSLFLMIRPACKLFLWKHSLTKYIQQRLKKNLDTKQIQTPDVYNETTEFHARNWPTITLTTRNRQVHNKKSPLFGLLPLCDLDRSDSWLNFKKSCRNFDSIYPNPLSLRYHFVLTLFICWMV